MDEELEQPNNKINLDSFFKSIESVEKVANNALNIANSNLNVIQQQKAKFLKVNHKQKKE